MDLEPNHTECFLAQCQRCGAQAELTGVSRRGTGAYPELPETWRRLSITLAGQPQQAWWICGNCSAAVLRWLALIDDAALT